MGGLFQYGPECFDTLIFATIRKCGNEMVNTRPAIVSSPALKDFYVSSSDRSFFTRSFMISIKHKLRTDIQYDPNASLWQATLFQSSRHTYKFPNVTMATVIRNSVEFTDLKPFMQNTTYRKSPNKRRVSNRRRGSRPIVRINTGSQLNAGSLINAG